MKMNEKPIAIYQDQRIAEEWCNFQCEYCEGFYPSEYSLKRDKCGNLHVADEWYKMIDKFPSEVRKYFDKGRRFEEFYKIASDIMDKSKNVMETDVLKISGGELTIYSDLCDYVDKIHNNYKMIQILSNGSNIKESDIKRYKEMGNVSFQISLDGISSGANYSKSHSATITKKVVDTIDLLLKYGIGVEINCVLTKYNTDKFSEFLNHFKGAKNLIIVPRPVRGEPRKILDFNEEQIESLQECVRNNIDKYGDILPPLAYFERLFDIMKTGKRNYRCYIPYFIQSIDGYGNFEMCPIGLQYNETLNLLANEIDSNSILINSNYDLGEEYPLCNYCIIQYEMLNLYVDSVITLDELKKMPSLNNESILLHIKQIKDAIIEKKMGSDKNDKQNKRNVLS